MISRKRKTHVWAVVSWFNFTYIYGNRIILRKRSVYVNSHVKTLRYVNQEFRVIQIGLYAYLYLANVHLRKTGINGWINVEVTEKSDYNEFPCFPLFVFH